MRASSRLLAKVQSSRFLTAGNPTGLAGLQTHPAPRSTLIYLYSSTLSLLEQFPGSSAYRVSTEALTKHRLSIVEAIKPSGYDEWATKAKKALEQKPELFGIPAGEVGSVEKIVGDKRFVRVMMGEDSDVGEGKEWDGEEVISYTEGAAQGGRKTDLTQRQPKGPTTGEQKIDWQMEPPLEAEQVEDIENKIGAGLIEEVIQVAEGELKAAQVLFESKVWEELEERPLEGQWEYFQRDRHTPQTQKPPKA